MANPENVQILYVEEFQKLQLVLDSSKRIGVSNSGKTILVASTHGAVPFNLPNGTTLYLSLNAYVYPPKEKKHGF